MPSTLEDLYTPLTTPAPLGQTPPPPAGSTQTWGTQAQQAMASSLTGAGSLTQGATPTVPAPTLPIGTGQTAYQGPVFSQEQIANVGGVMGTQAVDREVKLPEAQYEEDIEEAEFKEAEAVGGRKHARNIKQADRYKDRKARHGKIYNEETGKFEKTGTKLKGKAKRQERRRQRKMRNNSWKAMKGK